MPSSVSPGRSPSRILRRVAYALVAVIVGLTIIEGMSSFLLLGFDVYQASSQKHVVTELQEEFHCQYDRELGWANIPGTKIPDFYGPGAGISINQLGLRGAEVIPSNPKRKRLVCLGDSFTLGYGVDDAETFPEQLQQLAGEELQILNMGQGGYSVGQSWLWLKRLMPEIRPDYVVCVFIWEDFRRLTRTRTVNGFSTPGFTFRNNRIDVSNIPVPRKLDAGTQLPAAVNFLSLASRRSGLVQGIQLLMDDDIVSLRDRANATGCGIIGEIAALCRAAECKLAVVLTPTLQDLLNPIDYSVCAGTVSTFLLREGIPFTNLAPAFRTADSDGMFLEEEFHHYSAKGNRIVADSLAEWLANTFPELKPVFAALQPDP